MATGMYCTFYAGTGFYLLAAFMALFYLRNANASLLKASTYTLMAGIVLFGVSFKIRWAIWGHLPLTTMTDSIELFVVFAAVMSLVITHRNTTGGHLSSLLSFYVPPLAVICLVNASVAHRFLAVEPREFRSWFLAIHVGIAFLSYAFFYLASMTSAAYLCQAAHLKHHRIS